MLAVKLALTLAGMAVIPHGSFSPLYAVKGAERVSVGAFALDREPVTRGEYLEFVRRNPQWRKSAVKSAAADAGYLAGWQSDLNAGSGASLLRPVTNVSRNAAYAYCKAKGKRLPTSAEWEYTAAASETKREATRDRGFISRLVGFYASRGSATGVIGNQPKNAYGVRDLHELVWEWTDNPGESHMSHTHHMFCASSAIGASDPANYPAFMRYAVRSGLTDRSTLNTLGFRCAADLSA